MEPGGEEITRGKRRSQRREGNGKERCWFGVWVRWLIAAPDKQQGCSSVYDPPAELSLVVFVGRPV